MSINFNHLIIICIVIYGILTNAIHKYYYCIAMNCMGECMNCGVTDMYNSLHTADTLRAFTIRTVAGKPCLAVLYYIAVTICNY